jgi:hypothetical protein
MSLVALGREERSRTKGRVSNRSHEKQEWTTKQAFSDTTEKPAEMIKEQW